MEPLRSYIKQRPRTAAAFAFGSVTMAVTHFAWVPGSRINGVAPALTIAAGLAHALAGAITGRHLLDARRTRTPLQAGLVGAVTSLLAVALFSPAFVFFLRATDVRPSGAMSYLLLAVLTGVFSFFGAGWALLFISVGVGWGLYRLAVPSLPPDEPATTSCGETF
jgi:hypothetical protein